jgi:hypothetical protein
MKYAANRPYADPEAAARKLVEIVSGIEPTMPGRIYIVLINGGRSAATLSVLAASMGYPNTWPEVPTPPFGTGPTMYSCTRITCCHPIPTFEGKLDISDRRSELRRAC